MDENPYKSPETRSQRERPLPWTGRTSIILFAVAGLSALILMLLHGGAPPRRADEAFRVWAISMAAWVTLITSFVTGLVLAALKLAGR